ncbi:MAG: TonB-dependent receptor [Prevotella sp.]|nr:TonB-dependent receptor [Prevotella sp.]
MYNNTELRRKSEPIVFHRFGHKGYSLFAVLGRELLIGVLSVATLSHAKADGVGVLPVTDNDGVTKTDRELTLDEVSITGSRAPMASQQAARIVTVLVREDIQRAPVQSINDLLKYAVGIDVRQRGPLGAQTDINLRGGNYEQVAIFLNGINICDPQTGHNALDIPADLSEVERIEVLEGPAGRVFGTSSMLGAVNIVTRPAEQSSVTAHVDGGSYGYFGGGARVNLRQGEWNNQVSGGYTRGDGFSRNKAGRLNADFSGGKAFYQGTYRGENIAVRWHAGLSSRNYGANTFYGLGSDDQFEHTFKSYTAIQAETLCGRLHFKPSVYWNHSKDRFEYFRGRGSDDVSKFNYHRQNIFGVNLNSYFDWAAGRTAFGAEIRNEDIVSGNLGEPLGKPQHISGTNRDYTLGLNRTNVSFMLEHNIILKRFTLSAGLMAIKNSWNQEPLKIYPGVDASLEVADGMRIYASYNTSLRMPSVTELYLTKDGHKADKYLKPEELSSVEGGVKYNRGGVNAKANVYYNHITNLIDWIRRIAGNPDAPYESVNFSTVNAVGFEAEAAADFLRLVPSQKLLRRLSLSYSYLHQDVEKPEEGIQSMFTLEYLRHKLVASASLNLCRNLGLDIYYRWQDRMGTYTDISGGVKNYRPYGVVDARLQWNMPQLKAYVEVNNLFDTTYVDHGYVPQPGAWFMAGCAVNINL